MQVYTINHLEIRVSNGQITAATSGIFSHGFTDLSAALTASRRLAKYKRLKLIRAGAYSSDAIRIEMGKNGTKVCWGDSYDEYSVVRITVKEG